MTLTRTKSRRAAQTSPLFSYGSVWLSSGYIVSSATLDCYSTNCSAAVSVLNYACSEELSAGALQGTAVEKHKESTPTAGGETMLTNTEHGNPHFFLHESSLCLLLFLLVPVDPTQIKPEQTVNSLCWQNPNWVTTTFFFLLVMSPRKITSTSERGLRLCIPWRLSFIPGALYL